MWGKISYNWLTRLETEDLDEAFKDKKRPDRPRKIDEYEHVSIHHNPLITAGFDALDWTVRLVQELLSEEFEEEQKRGHVWLPS